MAADFYIDFGKIEPNNIMAFFDRIKTNHILAISVGVVYLWFGMLKFFAQLSPAEELAQKTIDLLTFGLVVPDVSIILLAIWETAVGTLLILNVAHKPVIVLALIHMACTFAPLFLFPDKSFSTYPFGYTLLGQYIFKNVVIIAALVTLYREENHKLVTG